MEPHKMGESPYQLLCACSNRKYIITWCTQDKCQHSDQQNACQPDFGYCKYCPQILCLDYYYHQINPTKLSDLQSSVQEEIKNLNVLEQKKLNPRLQKLKQELNKKNEKKKENEGDQLNHQNLAIMKGYLRNLERIVNQLKYVQVKLDKLSQQVDYTSSELIKDLIYFKMVRNLNQLGLVKVLDKQTDELEQMYHKCCEQIKRDKKMKVTLDLKQSECLGLNAIQVDQIFVAQYGILKYCYDLRGSKIIKTGYIIEGPSFECGIMWKPKNEGVVSYYVIYSTSFLQQTKFSVQINHELLCESGVYEEVFYTEFKIGNQDYQLTQAPLVLKADLDCRCQFYVKSKYNTKITEQKTKDD